MDNDHASQQPITPIGTSVSDGSTANISPDASSNLPVESSESQSQPTAVLVEPGTVVPTDVIGGPGDNQLLVESNGSANAVAEGSLPDAAEGSIGDRQSSGNEGPSELTSESIGESSSSTTSTNEGMVDVSEAADPSNLAGFPNLKDAITPEFLEQPPTLEHTTPDGSKWTIGVALSPMFNLETWAAYSDEVKAWIFARSNTESLIEFLDSLDANYSASADTSIDSSINPVTLTEESLEKVLSSGSEGNDAATPEPIPTSSPVERTMVLDYSKTKGVIDTLSQQVANMGLKLVHNVYDETTVIKHYLPEDIIADFAHLVKTEG